jgi:hypothetical protein
MPYVHDLGPGGKSKPTVIPLTRREHHNFILGTYSTQEAFDTDDGSSYYAMSANFLVYGSNGLKSDFGGHTHSSIGDIYAVRGMAWCCHGVAMVLPWCCHGVAMVLPWCCHAVRGMAWHGNGLTVCRHSLTLPGVCPVWQYIANCFGDGNFLEFVNNTCILNFQPTATHTGGYASDCHLSPGELRYAAPALHRSAPLPLLATDRATECTQGWW